MVAEIFCLFSILSYLLFRTDGGAAVFHSMPGLQPRKSLSDIQVEADLMCEDKYHFFRPLSFVLKLPSKPRLLTLAFFPEPPLL